MQQREEGAVEPRSESTHRGRSERDSERRKKATDIEKERERERVRRKERERERERFSSLNGTPARPVEIVGDVSTGSRATAGNSL